GEVTSVRAGLSRAAVAKVWAAGGKLSLAQLLRCRVRYLGDGVAVGREAFLESVFGVLRERFTEGRESGARRMRGGEGWGELRTLRALRVNPVEPSG
ncbi:MAG: putative transposase, partial [Verrucomicrobiales bacterium]